MDTGTGVPAGPEAEMIAPAAPHDRPLSCNQIHDEDYPRNGAPLCFECHDMASAVMWQWHAPELWRRFTIVLRRGVAHGLAVPEARLGEVASIQYAKVAEYQARGLVHFHALIRLDGPAAGGVGSSASASLDGNELVALVFEVVPTVTTRAEPVDRNDVPRVLAWGQQVDVRIVRDGSRADDPNGPLTPDQVAGYLAKYSTKEASGLHGQGQRRPHITTLRKTCRDMAERAATLHDPDHDYQRMSKWVHSLGFRGHFGTKSRRYSLTLGALRRARARWPALATESRRTGQPIDTRDLEARLLAGDEDDTTQVVGSWTYAGTGWRDTAEEALAIAAANRAREYEQWKTQQRQTRTELEKGMGMSERDISRAWVERAREVPT